MKLRGQVQAARLAEDQARNERSHYNYRPGWNVTEGRRARFESTVPPLLLEFQNMVWPRLKQRNANSTQKEMNLLSAGMEDEL
jgi:hypothetical protein